MEKKLRFSQLQILRTHLTLWYPEKQSNSWMKFMITKKSLGPVTNGAQLKGDPRAARKLVLSSAWRKLVRTLSAILFVILCSRNSYSRGERKWIAIDANHYRDAVCLQKYPKWSRHYDQAEREQDGSYHWETVKSLLLRICTGKSKIIFWQLLDSSDPARQQQYQNWILHG